MAPPTLHGIPNCDTVRRARAWLDAQGVSYAFHDFRRQGLAPATLQAWIDELGWEALLNRAGTSFRKLPEAERQGLDAARALRLMLAEPAMIRRPVLDLGARRVLGFRPEAYAALFARG